MGAVFHILQAKGNVVHTISPDISVYNALVIMLEKNVSSLVVMEDEKPVGIVTETDYARKVVLKGKGSRETPVSEIMNCDLITVTTDYSIDECMGLMTDNFIRHLPVVENEKLIGLVSIGDVVKYIIEEQKFIIKNMEGYITGI